MRLTWRLRWRVNDFGFTQASLWGLGFFWISWSNQMKISRKRLTLDTYSRLAVFLAERRGELEQKRISEVVALVQKDFDKQINKPSIIKVMRANGIQCRFSRAIDGELRDRVGHVAGIVLRVVFALEKELGVEPGRLISQKDIETLDNFYKRKAKEQESR
jgi:hypothetical protein